MNTIRYFTIIALIMSFSFNQELSAQRLKRLYSHIEKNNIERAIIESGKFSSIKSHDDRFIYGLSNCLLLINENFPGYDPYKALAEFEKTTSYPANRDKVNKFLRKYKLDIEKIHFNIYDKIFSDAKKQNTEESFRKFLEVCTNCYYRHEAIRLKEIAGYSEAKNQNTIVALKKFIENYPHSEFNIELTELIVEIAFQEAKSIMTVEALNSFLVNYGKSGNKFYNSGLHLRDSIAFSNLRRTYTDYKKFLIDYPETKYTESITKELPNLLYNQALNENNIELLELFVLKYPGDNRKDFVNQKIEALYYQNLISNFSISDFETFKRKYPTSRYIEALNERFQKIFANNDLILNDLKGPVKSIIVTSYDPRQGNRIIHTAKQEFNSLGYFVYNEPYTIFSDNFNTRIYNSFPPEFENENRHLFIGGSFTPSVTLRNMSWSSRAFQYVYDGVGLLKKAYSSGIVHDFIHNENGELIERNVRSRDYVYKIKYFWSGGKLVAKEVLSSHGYVNLYEIDHYSNIKKILVKNERKLTEAEITIYYDFNGLITKRKIEQIKDIDGIYNFVQEYNYTYCANNKLIRIELSSRTREDVYGTHRVTKEWRDKPVSTLSINRDHNGQITSISSDPRNEMRYEYTYDSLGNWTNVNVFKVEQQVIEVKTLLSVIERRITYY